MLVSQGIIGARISSTAGKDAFDWLVTGYHMLYVVIGIVAIVLFLMVIAKVEREMKKKAEREREERRARWQNESRLKNEAADGGESREDTLRQHFESATAAPVEQPQPIILRRQARHHNTDFAGGTSWLGGLPALGDQPWPRDMDGKALHLLAQIDCASLSTLNPDVGFPIEGSLVFFARIAEWPHVGRVIYVPTPAGGSETQAPDDLPLIYDGPDWGYYIKDCDKASAPRMFARWPVDFLALDLPGSAEEEELQEAVAALRGGEAEYGPSINTNTMGKYFSNGQEPWLWGSAQRFAASLRHSLEDYPKKVENLETQIADFLASSKKINSHQGLTQKQKEEMMQSSKNAVITHQAKLKKIHAKEEAFRQFVHETSEWADGQDASAPLPEQDSQKLKEVFEMVSGFWSSNHDSIFTIIYMISSEYHGLSYATNDALLSMISGPQEVYDLLPEQIKSEVDRGCLFGGDDDWHQIFGIGDQIQTATEKNTDKYMLLQINSDYLMNWMWGDVGVIKYWIRPDDLKNGRWDTVFTTIEGA